MGSGRRRAHGVGQVECFQAAPGKVAGFADLLVGPGVVVAGANEPAAVVAIYGDLVGVADEPAEDLAGFAELIAESVGTPGGAVELSGDAEASAVISSRDGGLPLAADSVTGVSR
jgi:hypothetical protein